MALGARFQNLKGGLTIRGGGAKFSEGARFWRATMFFCKHDTFVANIVINYSCHYVYSNIFDTLKSLTQNDHGSVYPYNNQMLLW